MREIPELFGCKVFNDSIMRNRLPKDVYRALRATISEGAALDPTVADVVASAMKDWAIGQGVTHYTHWFQPMTGITAEKHDAFLALSGDGLAITEFSGKELIKGEPDASSFPSGGLRATFEARGYTAWDPTSYAFIKDDTLCIPTAFCSYRGEVLDKKTPLLRSMDVISRQAIRILRLFGKEVRRVTPTVGAEQEYFLINKADYARRADLVLTGRTLFGAPAPKGQEMGSHYFGSLRPRVKAFMADLDETLWELGIPSKTEHNEVAPCQHEMAPIFTTVNLSTDQNQLAMEMMKRVADRHGFVCLLHEKPFDGINGSGKHNNWSLTTDTGENLLDPGRTPADNAQFLLFLTAVIRAVDDYQDLLRLSVANAGNDLRLGGHEAPPAIVSIYIGDELEQVIDTLISGAAHDGVRSRTMDIGVTALPPIPLDNSDRNRTSPFAFTGNKFEFRMLGSSFNIACTNVMINTAVAKVLKSYADQLEQAQQFDAALSALIRQELRAHRRILFSGNGYAQAWTEEAQRRGLLNLPTTPDALSRYDDEKNLRLFSEMDIYTPEEVRSRQEILQEEYGHTVLTEARTAISMLKKQIVPACAAYSSQLAQGAAVKQSLGISASGERQLAEQITEKTTALLEQTAALERAVQAAPAQAAACARYCADTVRPAMAAARQTADTLEGLVDESHWPFPTYRDLLFYV